MSKFTARINEFLKKPTSKEEKEKADKQSAIAGAKKRVAAGQGDNIDKQIVKKDEVNRKKALQDMNEAEGDEFVPRQGPETGGDFKPTTKDDVPQDDATAPQPKPVTTEGESFYVNLARKALFVDLDNVSLTDSEREVVTQDVQPENAKEVAKVLRKIISDFGLGESFDSKIDTMWENLQLSDLRSKLSIEDVKKNTVALVPGSFKPPHKGHYAMIEHFANIADEVIVIISDPTSPKSIRRTPAGKQVTAREAYEILEIYTRKDAPKVKLITNDQPVKWVYDYVADDTVAGQNILLGVSGKGDDVGRYANAQKYAPEGVNVEASVFTDSDLNISATDFRKIIDQPSIENITPYIPDHLRESEIQEVLEVLLKLTEKLS